MLDRNIIKILLRQKQTSQLKLADSLGLKSQSNIAGIINRKDGCMGTDNFVKIVTALNADVVVYDLTTNRKFKVSPDGMSLKSVLRAIIAEKRVSQKWLADQLGLTQSSISSYVSGTRTNMRMNSAISILEVMGCVMSVYDKDTGLAYEVNMIDDTFGS